MKDASPRLILYMEQKHPPLVNKSFSPLALLSVFICGTTRVITTPLGPALNLVQLALYLPSNIFSKCLKTVLGLFQTGKQIIFPVDNE